MLEKGCIFFSHQDTELGTERVRKVIVKDDEKIRILMMCHDGIDRADFGCIKGYAKVTILIMLFTHCSNKYN